MSSESSLLATASLEELEEFKRRRESGELGWLIFTDNELILRIRKDFAEQAGVPQAKPLLTSSEIGDLIIKAVHDRGGSSDDLYRIKADSDLQRTLVEAIISDKAKDDSNRPIIDCDADPLVMTGWKVEEHRKGGQFNFDSSEVRLYLSNSQWGRATINGHELRKELSEKPILNANVLDYLLAHPQLIPDEWKEKAVFFWGTIYCSDESSFVRYLSWRGGMWAWNVLWLGHDWCGGEPAALRVKITDR